MNCNCTLSEDGQILNVSVGDNGIFYISYEDAYIYSDLLGIENAEDKKDYDNLYQYDNLGGGEVGYIKGNDVKDIFLANVFTRTKTDTEYLTSIGFQSLVEGTYEVYINPDGTDKSLSNLQKAELTTGEEISLTAGYHTINFKKAYKLKENNLSGYIDEFVNKLDSKINTRVMNVTSIDEYKKYFYKTDHHWTIYGALDGYQDICDMLGIQKLNDLNALEHKEKKYYGSLAKTALNDSINDYISDVDIKLDYDVYVNGKETDKLFKPREIRLDRDYKYYDYYVQYFNGQYGNVVYDYHDDNKENLLIVGDSYSWQIDYLIASSFNKTHVINLRYDEYKNKEFNLSKYVSDNNISKVLFLYDGGSSIFDQYNYDFEGRVK